jgi:hypothetical protein
LADEIRGFGPVKDAAVKSYRERVKALEQEFFAIETEPARGRATSSTSAQLATPVT